jgi:predicted TIM-barrel fold metal-dependent hydrolase
MRRIEQRWLPFLFLAFFPGACGRGCTPIAHDGDGPYRPKSVSELTGEYKIVNAHEHLQSVRAAERLLRVMDETSVAKTVIVGSSRRTTVGMQNAFVQYEENNAQMLEAARRWPERFVPFVTIDTDDPNKLKKLERWIQKGARGLKLYSGHGDFHTRPLNVADMLDVYRYCEKHKVPIIFHVNGGRYLDEFEPILRGFPDLQIICPHLCLLANNPETFRRLMDTYPQLMTDISFGVPAVMNEGIDKVSARPKRFREFLLAYPDRFLWGSDVVVTGHSRKDVRFLRDVFDAYFAMLARSSYSYQPYDKEYHAKPGGPVERNGVALPPDVLRQILETNFTRINVPRP